MAATRPRSTMYTRSRLSTLCGEAAVLPISSDIISSAPPDYDSLFPNNKAASYVNPSLQYPITATGQPMAQNFVDFLAPEPTIASTRYGMDTKQPMYHSYQPKVHPAYASCLGGNKLATHYRQQDTANILQTASSYLTNYLSSVTCGLFDTNDNGYNPVVPDQKPALLTDAGEVSEQAKTAQPITPDHLRRLHATLDLTNVEDIRFWAICLVGFYGLVRKSSLAVKDKPTPHTLLRANVSIQGQHVSLGVPGGKHVKHPIYWHLARASDPRLCPLTALRAWMPHWSSNTSHGVFELPTGHANQQPTYTWLEARLQRALSEADIKGIFTIHSFRLGGAACAKSAGIPHELVRQLGGWENGPGLKSRDSRLMAERLTEYVCRDSI